LGNLIKWELTDPSGTYSGLMIVGEQATAHGFQTIANMTVDLGKKAIPADKIQELARIVNTEFSQRAVISLNEGSSKVQ
jgi:hypothetical protein